MHPLRTATDADKSEEAVRGAIAALSKHDRELAKGIDSIVTEVAPHAPVRLRR